MNFRAQCVAYIQMQMKILIYLVEFIRCLIKMYKSHFLIAVRCALSGRGAEFGAFKGFSPFSVCFAPMLTKSKFLGVENR